MKDVLKNIWYAVCWSGDIKKNEVIGREVLGINIAIYRNKEGTVVALEDRCPHRSAPLHMGSVCSNGNLQCGYHGLQFDARGRCVLNPHGNGVIPITAKVQSFPICERYTVVWIWMGESAPDESLIPDLGFVDTADEVNITFRDVLEMNVNYRLVVDNLLDLSHVSFVHGGILGNDTTVAANISVRQEGNLVTQVRWMSEIVPPGLFDMLYKRDGRSVDHWSEITWHPASCLVNDAGVTAVGARKTDGTGIYGIHLLTPVNDRKTIYHFAAVRQNPIKFSLEIHREIMENLRVLRRKAFVTQDQPIIEGQQYLIDKYGPERSKPVLLNVDGATARYARILDGLIANENAHE